MASSAGIRRSYSAFVQRKISLFFVLFFVLISTAIYSIGSGTYRLSPEKIVSVILGFGEPQAGIVVWNIRMPRIAAALVAGWGLGLSGLAIQCLLRNPLGSPFTLGISHGAAFGAAFAIVVLGAGRMANTQSQSGVVQTVSTAGPLTVGNIYSVTLCAFLGAIVATAVILALAKIKKLSAEAVILAGVALSSLFVSGTILVQYFATEVEIASVVFWTFGDVGRPTWTEVAVIFFAVAGATTYFMLNRWNLNALQSGDEAAGGLGVDVDRIRLWGMFIAALVSALVTAFMGVVAFVGLLAPHIGRRLVGDDHRFLVPHSCIIGSLLLLASDTVGRTIVGSGTLPVGVLTSFMGAPLFLYLLVRGYNR